MNSAAHQPQFRFAQPVPSGVAAEGRSLVVPPCGAPATIPYQQQTWTDTERGLAREVMCPSALDVAQDWSLRRAGLIGANNCRGRNNPVLFLADDRGCNPRLAINIKSTRRGHFQCVSQRDPSHLSQSSSSSTYASKTIQKRRRGLGKVIRELGPVVQGVAHE